MKKILFIITAVIFTGCNEKEKQDVADYAIISGKILNTQAGEVTINSEDATFKEVVTIAEDGSFTDTLNTDIKKYVLYDGFNPIFLNLESGYNLNINYDVKDFDNTIAISGEGSKINNYLIEKRKAEKSLSKEMQDVYTLDENQFKARMLTFKNAQENVLKNTKNLTSDFKSKEKKNIHYAYLAKLNSYERTHKYFTKKTSFQVSDEFLKEVKSIDYTNVEDFKFSNDYKGLVTDYFGNKANELVQSDGLPFDMAFLKTASKIDNETIKNTLLFEFANYNLTYAKDVEGFYNSFLKNSTNEKNNAIILKKYNTLTGLNKGKPSPKFVGYENYKGGKTSLDDLKGKYVYIDVWATWCGPCIKEIPALKNIEKKYHGKNIEFVSISVDSEKDHDKWMNMVKEKELTGIQLFANNKESSFAEDYQIDGIPRFILIDTEGHIVNANAPRPSDSNLINLLNSLNI